MTFMEFLVTYKWPLLFYLAVILIIYIFRKKFEWHGLAGLYKTSAGLKLMDKIGTKYRGLVQLLGYIGIGVGFIGMALIVWQLGMGLWNWFFVPDALPVVSPVLPGFGVPGLDLHVPLIEGLIVLFLLVVIHEFSHGVVMRAHDVRVKSSGLLVFGPIAGAFVEQDEKQLAKQSEAAQYSMFAAGPFSNLLTAGLAMLFVLFLFNPLLNSMEVPAGVRIISIDPGSPAEAHELQKDMVITAVEGVPVRDTVELSNELNSVQANETVTLYMGSTPYAVTTRQHPDPTNAKGYIGIKMDNYEEPKLNASWFVWLHKGLVWFKEKILDWFIILSIGIGLANLLPLGPVDGGHMLRLAARQITGNKKRGDWWWMKISYVVGFIIIFLLIMVFFP